MILDLVSPFDRSLRARIVISETTGEAVVYETTGGTDLDDAVTAANDSRHAGVEPWVPPLNYLLDWAEERGILTTERNVPDREPVDPDLVY